MTYWMSNLVVNTVTTVLQGINNIILAELFMQDSNKVPPKQ